MDIHFLLSVLLKSDNLLQRAHSKQLVISNILKHLNCLLSEVEWKPLNQSQVLILPFFDSILNLKRYHSFFISVWSKIFLKFLYSHGQPPVNWKVLKTWMLRSYLQSEIKLISDSWFFHKLFESMEKSYLNLS